MLPDAPRERLTLPAVPAPAPSTGFPLVATLAPVVVSLVLWMLTQSVYSLLFAFLGPVVALGGLLDGRIGRRRSARRERERYLLALRGTAAAIAAAHDRERARLERLSPDPAAGADAAMGWAETARSPSPGHPIPLRIGTGTLAGRIDLSGDDPDEVHSGRRRTSAGAGSDAGEPHRAARAVRALAAVLPDAPLVVDARDGIGVTGPPVLAAAVARALAVRLAARFSPSDAALTAPAGEAWLEQLPHAVSAGADGTYRWSEHAAKGGAVAGSAAGSAARADPAPVLVSWAEREADLPPGCGIRIATGARAGITGDRTGEEARDVRPGALGAAEATAAAQGWIDRAMALGLRPPGAELPELVRLAGLLPHGSVSGTLAAPIGRDGGGAVVIDLVAQGPHAVIAGTTGSGKSELLVSWILGMASGRSPDEVAFLLVDFKGGSAFAPLAVLPHVLATLSDLDARLTRRAIESLRAELLHRERVLAAASARSIDELSAGTLPRLVIVVDEYAAVVATSPELHEVFGDLAARGRSLGLHLILCTQRPAGVIRDAVLANVTLRLSLRVTDRGDSVAMLGDDAASRLPAVPRGRGILAGDDGPRMLQLAIAEPADATRIAGASPPASVRRPWCDPLATEIALDDLPPVEQGLVFGMLDLPAEQRQPPASWEPDRHGHLLVLGAAGSGSTTVLQTLAVSAQRAGRQVYVVPREPADAWQLLSTTADLWADRAILLIDDLDALVAGFEPDLRHEFLELLTDVARGRAGSGRGPGMAVAAHRLTGALTGIAGQFGSRLILRQTSRDEHVLAGGDARDFDPDLPAGSGTWRGGAVQVARASDPDVRAAWNSAVPDVRRIVPAEHAVLAVVAGRTRAIGDRLRATGARVIELGGGAAPHPAELTVTTAGGPASGPAGGVASGSSGAVPTVLLGDPDAWLGEWALLAAARRDWPVVLLGVAPADHRALLRDRTLPPPLGSREGECWLSIEGRTVRAILDLGAAHA